MTDPLYADPLLYDLVMHPEPFASFYAEEARKQGGSVLEVACGNGQILVPVAANGGRAVGVDLAEEMLAAGRARAAAAGVAVEWVQADMRGFDLGERFDFVYLARNSLLHLHRNEDLLACLRCVRRHLRPGGTFVLDVFNPDVRMLARAAGERFRLRTLAHPARGEVTLEQVSDYDAAAQVNRATWFFSSPGDPDFLVAPLHLRSIFPQELRLLLDTAGFRVERVHGDFAHAPFGSESRQQICVCRAP